MARRRCAECREKSLQAWLALMPPDYWRRWSEKDLAWYRSESEGVEAEWDEAHRMSREAGFPFKNRQKEWENWGAKPCFVEEVIDLFFREFPNNEFRQLVELRPPPKPPPNKKKNQKGRKNQGWSHR